MYLLEIVKCCNKLHTYNLYFCRPAIMSVKSIVCILLSCLSFRFDDFDTINLTPRHIYLCCIMLSIKKLEINDVLKTNNKFHPNSFNVLHEFVVII